MDHLSDPDEEANITREGSSDPLSRSAPLPDPCRLEARPPASILRDAPLYVVFKAVQTAFRHRALQQLRAQGIDLYPGVAPLLLHLGEEDDLTLSELARRCELENSTLTPLVDELERHGLATRGRDRDDRRLVRIRLTAAGQEMAPRLHTLWMRLQEQSLAGISDTEVQTLHQVMHRMVDNLGSE